MISIDPPAIDSPSDPATYDELLGPVLWSARGSAPEVLLAVMVRAIQEDKPSEGVNQWLTILLKLSSLGLQDDNSGQHGVGSEARESRVTSAVSKLPPGLDGLVRDSRRWAQLWDKAELKVNRSSPSDSGDSSDARKVVRGLFAGLLTPLPHGVELGYKRNLNLRVALAVVAMEAISNKRGRDSVIMSRPRLGTTVGWDRDTAGKILNLLCDHDILKRLRDQLNLFRVLEVDVERRDEIRKYRRSGDAFFDGTPDPIADVIKCVTHPAWGYSSTLNHGHWLKLLADVADVPVSLFQMTRNMERSLSATIEKLSLSPLNISRDLPGILDLIAEDPAHGPIDKMTGERISARVASERAEEKWALAGEKAKARVEELKLAKKAAFLEAKRERDAARKSGPMAGRSKRRSDDDDQDDAAETPVVIQDDAAEATQRKIQGKVSALLNALPIPTSPNSPDATAEPERKGALLAWLAAVRAVIIEWNPDEDFRELVGDAIQNELQAAGYGPRSARAFVAHTMYGDNLPVELATMLAA